MIDNLFFSEVDSLFFQKHKIVFHIMISLLLVFFLFSLVGYSAKSDTRKVHTIGEESFSELPKSGYDISMDKNGKNIVYTPNNNDPWTLLTFPQQYNLDYIIINFNESATLNPDVVVYYSTEGEPFSHTQVEAHYEVVDYSRRFIAVPMRGANCISIRLDIDASFSIKSVDFYDVEILSEPQYSFNIVVFLMLLGLVLLLIIFESKIGYFHSVRDVIRGVIHTNIQFFKEKRYFVLALSIVRWISNIVLFSAVGSVFIRSKAENKITVVIFIISAVSVALNIAYKIITQHYISPARFFFIVALIIGVMLAVCLPFTTYNVPDEEIHYACVTEVKHFLFNDSVSLADLRMQWRVYANQPYIEDSPDQFEFLAYDDSVQFSLPARSLNLYNRLAHFPAAIILAFADLLGLSFVQKFLFCKMFNLLVFVFLITLGIRRMKSGAYVMSAIFLFPSVLVLASSFSYDCWIIAFIPHAMAYFISELQMPEKKITTRDMVIMFGAMIIGCAPKAVYFVLMIPFLFMYKKKFESKKQHKIYVLACLYSMLVVMLSFVVPFFIDMGGASDYRGGDSVNAGEQLSFILSNIPEYISILFKFMSEFLSFRNMSVNIISHTYFNSPLEIYATILIFVMFFATFTDKSEKDLFNNRHLIKTVSILACVATAVVVSTALYLAFTPVGYHTINGVQYRYIFPIMPLFFYCLCPSRIICNTNKKVTQTVVYGISAIVNVLVFYDYYISLLLK